MHVLIIGGTGFIGSQVVSALVARGHEVTVVRHRPGHLPHPPRAGYAEPVPYEEGLRRTSLRNEVAESAESRFRTAFAAVREH